MENKIALIEEELKVQLDKLENTTDRDLRDYYAGIINGLETSLKIIKS